jgi:DNA-binding SARP family transcriptional activator
MTVEIGVLGPVTLAAGGRPVKLDRRKQRTLVAVLALRAGQVVTVDRLLECLWDADRPATARKQIHAYVSILRRQVILAGGAGQAIETVPDGYRLRVPAATVDLRQFLDQVEEAERQEAPEDASRTLHKALALWRGPALSGLSGRFVHGESRRLSELHRRVLHRRLDLDLSLGRHADLIPELTGLVEADPLDEGLRARLAVALLCSGRIADALAVCREGRRLSIEDLGVEPTHRLRATELAILRGELGSGVVQPGLAVQDGEPFRDRSGHLGRVGLQC